MSAPSPDPASRPGPAPLPETYRDCLEFLYARNQFAMKLGLDNIRALLDRLGRPQDGLVILHVAGTNGKGSVCSNLAALLSACGYSRVGLYTSPHLVSFRERIRVDGEPVSRDWILAWMRKAMGGILELGATYFEIATAMALDYFRHMGCGAVVLETGLGGRLDATNAVVPSVTVITSISLDHTQILGGSVEAIWREKAAILKPGIPMVVREERPHLLAELEEAARRAGSPVFTLRDYPWTQGAAVNPIRFKGRFADYALPPDLRSEEHQRENLALSLLAMETFLGRALPDPAVLLPRLREARVPGRTQFLTEPGLTPLLLDGAHNPGGMEALASWVARFRLEPGDSASAFSSSSRGRTVAVFSLMKDKDAAAIYRTVRGFADEVLFVPLGARFPRALAFADLEALLDPVDRKGLREFTLDAAVLRDLLEPGEGKPALVVACGSLYLLGELIPLLARYYQGLSWFRQFQDEAAG